MNLLLKRQLRKYQSSDQTSNQNLEKFLDAVDRSYTNFEEQFAMQQRAMGISSKVLFEENQQLKQEFNAQKEVIDKLNHVIDTLKFYELPEQEKDTDLVGLKLVDFMDNQTKKIVEINKEREKLLDKLAHQNQELSDYTHMVSHDLKSPLQSIETLTAWLKSDYQNKLDDAGKENLNLIRNNVEKMDILISDILEYSAIGKREIQYYDLDINKLVDHVLNSIEIPEHMSIIKKGIFPILKGDKCRLQQLFHNILDNAIKYNDKASGLIEIGVENREYFWEFYVKDNGRGIDKIYFDKIFKTFEKLENNPKSSGVGLSIVKKILDLYGGKVWLTSEINRGTTFFFTIKK